MKTPSQFRTLLRFHAFASPWIWLMPLAMGFLGFFGANRFYGNLSTVLVFFNQLFWMPLLIAAMAFLPEFFLSGSWTTPQTQQVQTYGADFMLTRAVDRSLVFRVRGILFWCIIMIAVASWIIVALFNPGFDLLLSAHTGAATQAQYYLHHLPGSFVAKTAENGDLTIRAPMGNFEIKVLMGIATLGVSALWLVLLPLVARLSNRQWIYRGVFLTVIVAAPLLSILVRLPLEPILVQALANLPVVVGGGLVVVVGGQLLAERLLRSVEFM